MTTLGDSEPGQDGYRQELVDESAMLVFAGRCASLLSAGGVVFLTGDLGAGKTTFARGVLRALGFAGAVKSPTYTLVEPYQVAGSAVYHCDFYRLAAPEELEFLGLRELFDEGSLWLIEWPERGVGCLPAPDLSMHIAIAGAGRSVLLRSASARGRGWLDDLRN